MDKLNQSFELESELTMPFIASNGRQIYYERHGQGPAVVFLHGAGSNGATWWQQLPVFKAHFTCILMDIRCFGRSVAPTAEFTLPNFVNDLLAVLEHEKIDQASIVGQSLGGMIGLKFALQQPRRIKSFVACDTSMALDHPRQVQIIHDRLRAVVGMAIEQRSLGQWFLKNKPAQAALYAQINHFNPSAHSIPENEWKAAMNSLNTGEALTPMAQLKDVACPVLLLVGREDPIVPIDIMQEVQKLIPNSELTVVDNAAHSAYFEQPEVFNEKVITFLKR